MALSPAESASYLSYLRGIGLQEDAARATALRNVAAIQRQVQSQVPEIARLGGLQRDRINGGFEARGVYRSGMRQQRLGEQAAGEGYRVGSVLGNAADKTGANQSQLESSLADLARQRSDYAAQYGVGA